MLGTRAAPSRTLAATLGREIRTAHRGSRPDAFASTERAFRDAPDRLGNRERAICSDRISRIHSWPLPICQDGVGCELQTRLSCVRRDAALTSRVRCTWLQRPKSALAAQCARCAIPSHAARIDSTGGGCQLDRSWDNEVRSCPMLAADGP
ncbi:hypothetical protein L1887_51920 [Cichorium endivia]|nr:hypothetical protein L1887_51920 [Cichorium endivia]